MRGELRVIEYDRQPSHAFQRNLRRFNESRPAMPDVFVRWSPGVIYEGGKAVDQEGRWEIWVELRPSTHSKADNEVQRGDEWNSKAQCWMRKLQVWQWPSGDYADLEGTKFFSELKKNNTWSRPKAMDEIEAKEAEEEAAERRRTRRLASDVTNYYNKYDSPIIGPHTGGDWRHRIR